MNQDTKRQLLTDIRYQLRMIEGLCEQLERSPASREGFTSLNQRCKRVYELSNDALSQLLVTAPGPTPPSA